MHRKMDQGASLLFTALMLFWVALLAGCATQKAYEDEAGPIGDVAVLHIASDWAVWMDNPAIVVLDGEILKFNVVTLEVTPGEHIIQMRCTRGFSTIFTPIPFSGPIEINVEGAHDYKVYCDVTDDKTYYWIEEVETGDVAAGERP